MSTDRVAALLADLRALDEERFQLMNALRKAVLGLSDSISEEVKYGGLLFAVKEPFCGIFAYARHVSLEFGDGASLPDEHRVLEGQGRLRRHIKLCSIDDISAKYVPEYLGLAFKAATRIKPGCVEKAGL